MSVQEKMLAAVSNHMARMGCTEGRVDSVLIYPNATDSKGWTEWLIKYQFASGGSLTVGAILRNAEQENVEFHS